MSVVITTPTSVVVGGSITATVAGLTATGVAKIRIIGPGDSVSTELSLTASGGAVDMATVAVVRPYKAGRYKVTVRDVTAGTTTTNYVRVYGT